MDKAVTPCPLTRDTMLEILENIYNEVYVLDRELNILYVNGACTRHYGLLPKDMIGKQHMDFVGNLWYPTVIPRVLQEKRALRVEQVTYTGESIVATATPVLDDDGQIDMIVCVTEETMQSVDIRYNPASQVVTYAQPPAVDGTEHCRWMNSDSPQMHRVLALAAQCARRDVSVLIQGETGTGKTLLAEYIHNLSARKGGPFTVLNCAAMPESLLEVELFGCAPNAFTDAPPKGRQGLFTLADGGTLFLDEIGELPLALQAKLLGVLESKRFIPVGAILEQAADVRILSATNRNLPDMVAQQQFREDLYWRLNVVDLTMPALRERPTQIIPLVEDFLTLCNQKYAMNKLFDKELLWVLEQYQWPGNIRQLKNLVERLLVTSTGNLITLAEAPAFLREAAAAAPYVGDNYKEIHRRCEEQVVQNAICNGAHTTRQLAEALKIGRSTASRLMQRYGTNCM